MVWTENQRLHSIRFHPDDRTGVIFGGVTNFSLPANPEILATISAGTIYPGAASLQATRPVGSFTSFDLQGLFGADGPGLNGGLDSCIHSDTNPGLEVYYAFYECAGPSTAVAGTPHRLYTIGEGIIVPTTLSVDHRGDVEMSYDIYLVDKTGAGSPIVKTEIATAALPATITNNSRRWTMGSMKVTPAGGGAGVSVEGKTNINLSFNPSVSQLGADSNKFDSVASLDSFTPKLTVTGNSPDWFGSVAPLVGQNVVRASTEVQFVERNGLATPMLLSFDGLLSWQTLVQGGPTAPAQSIIAIDITQPSGAAAFVKTGGVDI